MPQLIVLDRDGVINEDSDAYIKTPQEWLPIPGSLEAIGRLTQAGFRVVVVTNQSGIARRLFDLETLDQIHQKMRRAVEAHGGVIEAIFFCPHGPGDRCTCRKPEPGLFHEVAERLSLTLEGKWAVGDSLRDLQAARAVGARPALVLTGKGRKTQASAGAELDGVPVFADLADFVDHLLAEEAPRS